MAWHISDSSQRALSVLVASGVLSDSSRALLLASRESQFVGVVDSLFSFDDVLCDKVWQVVRSRWEKKYSSDMKVFNDKQCLLFDFILSRGGGSWPKIVDKELGMYRGVLNNLVRDEEYLVKNGFLLKLVYRNEVKGVLTDGNRYALMIHPRLVWEARNL